VATDHTPAELQWFDTLRTEHAFPLYWRGRSWLDTQILGSPGMERAFVSTEGELLDLARQMKHEREALGLVEDYIERLRELQLLGEHLSPHYRIGYERGGDGTEQMTYSAKGASAADAPLTLSFCVEVPAGDEHTEVRDAIHQHRTFGDSLVLSGEYIASAQIQGPRERGLSGKRDISLLEIGEAVDRTELPNMTITVVDPDGRRVIAMPFVGERRTRGETGVRLHSVNPDRTVDLVASTELHADASGADTRLTLGSRAEPGRYPHQLVNAIKLTRALKPPNHAMVSIELPAGPSQLLGELNLPEMDLRAYESVHDFILGLAELQEASGEYFQLPERFSVKQCRLVDRVARLLRGETVPWAGGLRALSVVREAIPDVLADAERGPSPLEVLHPDPVVSLFGHELHIGTVVISATVTIADDKYLKDPPPSGETVPVLLDPGPEGFTARLPVDQDK
jgi:hypothetical protein